MGMFIKIDFNEGRLEGRKGGGINQNLMVQIYLKEGSGAPSLQSVLMSK